MARKEQENPQLDMTPMIDVVFELIIFFVVTIKAEDIFASLNGNRPAPAASQSETEENDNQVKIDIGRVGRRGVILFNNREVNKTQLEQNIKQIAATSKKTPVLLRCAMESWHQGLVDAMDVCHKYGMYNLSIFSM